MTRHSLAFRQLAVLTAVHFMVDMLSGTLPGFLPVLLEKYTLSIGMGTVLLTLCAFSSNTIQLWAGTLRKSATRPLLPQIGLLLGCIICFIGLIPSGGGAMWMLTALVLILGVGVALVHPEGLRAVCAIDGTAISPAVATSIFMLSGFLGYAAGPLIGGTLVEFAGFSGLFLLIIPALLLVLFISMLRLRLAKDGAGAKNAPRLPGGDVLTFKEVFLVDTLINTGCTVIQGLLPTCLNEAHGFSLTFGGLSAMLFGAGAGAGALTTSFLIRRFHVIKCILWEITAGLPFLIWYLCAAGSASALPLLFLAGALVGAGFPQLVVLARTAPNGPSLGARMGLIVGGTWGVAGILLLGVGFLADRIGIQAALFVSPASFLAVLIITLRLLWKHREKKMV